MKWFAIIRAVLSLLPSIIVAIRALEEAIPGEGKGEQRLAALRSILETTYEAADDAVAEFESVWPVIATSVGVLVKVFNDTGWGKND